MPKLPFGTRRSLAMIPENSIQQALLTSALPLTGRQAEAREALQRYLSLKGTTSNTIAQFRARHRAMSDNPKWLAYSDRLVEALRRAGMPEELKTTSDPHRITRPWAPGWQRAGALPIHR
jgi:predicted Zn-dependent protease